LWGAQRPGPHRLKEPLRVCGLDCTPMSTLAIVLIILGVVLLAFFAAGLAVARRRANRPDFEADVAAADAALESARAEDRGWDRELLHAAAHGALRQHRPSSEWEALHLVLVDDRPGVEEDRAHLMATGPHGTARVILTREPDGSWVVEQVE
jgi:hypothetical protein